MWELYFFIFLPGQSVASGDFWCVSVVKKVVLFAFVVDKKANKFPSWPSFKVTCFTGAGRILYVWLSNSKLTLLLLLNSQSSTSVADCFTNCYSFSNQLRMEAWVEPASGIKPRPSRVKGGDRIITTLSHTDRLLHSLYSPCTTDTLGGRSGLPLLES